MHEATLKYMFKTTDFWAVRKPSTRLSVFGAMQTAQCKWRNASGSTQMANRNPNPNPNPNPLALRHLHCAVCIAPNTDSPSTSDSLC